MIEEETLPTYSPARYYPVRLGQIFQDRYQVVGKVGYGGSSTVWLAREFQVSRHVVLKICVSSREPNRELEIYKHIGDSEHKVDHVGKAFHRKLYSSFTVDGPCGSHDCLVQEPLGLSLDQVLDMRHTKTFDLELLKPPLRQILVDPDYLHRLDTKNLLLGIDDTSVFSVFEEAETDYQPCPRKVLDDRTIYVSRRVPFSSRLPIITDFGEVRLRDEAHIGEDIMPDVYRAPEIILRSERDIWVGIWSVAMVSWDIAKGRTLFKARNGEKLLDDRLHLAEMIAIMGPPPKELLGRSQTSLIYWDENGLAPIPDISLETLADGIKGEDVPGFLSFLRRILRWLPEERPTAGELMFDPWLMEGLGKFGQSK
ncbi:CMGC/SRPK protein kinase [Trichophyton rubrum D6]|uniref:non-specific serine/threonine protein kinase n=3 Tax=Trichophyton TaxID=5550 RepID=F2SID5_TRIRC|nr:CMGC/SRPK protein kinase [Trichophyton rubrum CBS 118892]EZF12953.1 CMGC/SRPK protein kinase [Trichophyton rubrum MR850]EZF39385.1 CMGC/SRPK protein kinase [Trichophyton rubrum CBS 100081]EZF60620.1 CMGC/SRPK protein kinase [Trichophyton rubrum CBS 289.86]EZF71249.1 CMGC/SRPK protein kinase [Trichophyton soudanense CBS 452.61]EZF81942.1 CMGC/SRPK protein kinase [Trichophyton rubrum MR1448]EZF92601.1 CMGC/SRPK protein kinase [Trichophyton rubrum MR1459]EZG03680.1 CMGC/SRPK protein kinase [